VSYVYRLEVFVRRVAITAASVLAIAGFGTTGALAASNPVGHGQPGTASPGGASCGDAGSTSMPAGFNTAGFANAETHYAGSDGTPSAANGAPNAVSEYDIACYQQTQAGH
jgi:hypothetical protein